MKATIIINENHTLLPEQEKLIDIHFDSKKFVLVPATGWTQDEMIKIMAPLKEAVVFVSPIPYMIKYLAQDAALNEAAKATSPEYPYCATGDTAVEECYVMANDRREKKELPGGKIIFTVAKTGWYLA